MARFRDKLSIKLAATRDNSLDTLLGLEEDGFHTVVWDVGAGACDICQRLQGMRWRLNDFLDKTQYDAPVYCTSHVDCRCSLRVRGPGGAEIMVYPTF